MKKYAVVSARIEPKVKEKGDKILSELGISRSEAITTLYEYVVSNHKLPLKKIPNARMRRAFAKSDKGIGLVECENTQDMFKKLKIPNAETRKAFEDSDKGIGLVYCKDIDDLFKKLGRK